MKSKGDPYCVKLAQKHAVDITVRVRIGATSAPTAELIRAHL
jgi:hypothetical protein